MDHMTHVQLSHTEFVNVLAHFHASDMYGNGWITLRDFILGTGTRLLRVGTRRLEPAWIACTCAGGLTGGGKETLTFKQPT